MRLSDPRALYLSETIFPLFTTFDKCKKWVEKRCDWPNQEISVWELETSDNLEFPSRNSTDAFSLRERANSPVSCVQIW